MAIETTRRENLLRAVGGYGGIGGGVNSGDIEQILLTDAKTRMAEKRQAEFLSMSKEELAAKLKKLDFDIEQAGKVYEFETGEKFSEYKRQFTEAQSQNLALANRSYDLQEKQLAQSNKQWATNTGITSGLGTPYQLSAILKQAGVNMTPTNMGSYPGATTGNMASGGAGSSNVSDLLKQIQTLNSMTAKDWKGQPVGEYANIASNLTAQLKKLTGGY